MKCKLKNKMERMYYGIFSSGYTFVKIFIYHIDINDTKHQYVSMIILL